MFTFAFKGKFQQKDGEETKKMFPFFFDPSEETELILFEARARGLVTHAPFGEGHFPQDEGGFTYYNTPLKYVKIFVYRTGFGIRKVYHSSFLCLDEAVSQIVEVRHPSMDSVFLARAHVLTKDEVREIYGSSSDAYKYLLRQAVIEPFVTLHDTSDIPREDVRCLRI